MSIVIETGERWDRRGRGRWAGGESEGEGRGVPLTRGLFLLGLNSGLGSSSSSVSYCRALGSLPVATNNIILLSSLFISFSSFLIIYLRLFLFSLLLHEHTFTNFTVSFLDGLFSCRPILYHTLTCEIIDV